MRADAACRDLRADSVIAYNRAVAGVDGKCEGRSAEELRARFAEAGVVFDAPTIKLRAVRYHVVRPFRPNESSLDVPMLIECDTRGKPLYSPEGMLQLVTAIYTRAEGAPHRPYPLLADAFPNLNRAENLDPALARVEDREA